MSLIAPTFYNFCFFVLLNNGCIIRQLLALYYYVNILPFLGRDDNFGKNAKYHDFCAFYILSCFPSFSLTKQLSILWKFLSGKSIYKTHTEVIQYRGRKLWERIIILKKLKDAWGKREK